MLQYSPWTAIASEYNGYTGDIDNSSTIYEALYNPSDSHVVSVANGLPGPAAGTIWENCG
jgi:hypothetical protein